MLEDLLLLPLEAGIDWLIGRDDDRTTTQRVCLALGIVVVLLAIVLAVVSGPVYGLACGVVAAALLLYGA